MSVCVFFISLEFVPSGPIDSGLGNGMALIRQQAITWTNGGQVLSCHIASLSYDELNESWLRK